MTSDGQAASPWLKASYGGDKTWNVNGRAHNGAGMAIGMPAAVIRGGNWIRGAEAGAFSVTLTIGPSGWSTEFGARCCRW